MRGLDNLKLEPTRQFAEYWLNLAKDGQVPRKSCLRPWEIKKVLPYMVVLELVGGHSLKYRLVGTALVNRLGTDLTGYSIPFEYEGDPGNPHHVTLHRVVTQPCGYRFVCIENYASGSKAAAEAVGFPFCDDAGNNRFVVTVSVEFQKQYSELIERNELADTSWVDHEFLDVGYGVPEPVTAQKPHQMADSLEKCLDDG